MHHRIAIHRNPPFGKAPIRLKMKVGDVLEVPDNTITVKGEVIDINFLFTTFKIEENKVVQIPNKTFLFKPVIRAYGEESISLYEQLKSDRPAD